MFELIIVFIIVRFSAAPSIRHFELNITVPTWSLSPFTDFLQVHWTVYALKTTERHLSPYYIKASSLWVLHILRHKKLYTLAVIR
jgi:hypothetical protein